MGTYRAVILEGAGFGSDKRNRRLLAGIDAIRADVIPIDDQIVKTVYILKGDIDGISFFHR